MILNLSATLCDKSHFECHITYEIHTILNVPQNLNLCGPIHQYKSYANIAYNTIANYYRLD